MLIEEEKVDGVADIKNFDNVLELWDDLVFRDAEYKTNKRGEIVLHKLVKLPDVTGLKIIRDYILPKMEELMTKFSYVPS